ncbi:MAG: threonine synthase [Deltaproteobacteria bacterium]|nr:threonine synthase [Deltaproteobacteria bacterium]
MTYIKGLKCKECGQQYGLDIQYICEECFGPVEVDIDVESAAKDDVSWDELADLLIPAPKGSFSYKSSRPLKKAERLGRRIGINHLYLKDEGGTYPSLSFKDRVVATALSRAVDEGIEVIACASTGNLANALAAHASNAGIKSVVFVPEGIDYGKIGPAITCGALVFEVRGNYDAANRLCSEVHEALGWPVVNGSLKPYYLEGAKGIAYEILRFFKDGPQISIVSPVGGGGLLMTLWKGIKELQSLGLVSGDLPLLYAIQADGCAPVINAVKSGSDEIRPVKPDTAIGAIAIGDPPDGYYALKAIKESGGSGESAGDEEAFPMVRLLAEEEGIITGPTGGAALAAASKLVGDKTINDGRPVVVLLPDRGPSGALIDEKVKKERLIKVNADLTSFMEVWKQVSEN